MSLHARVFCEADFGHHNPRKQKAWSGMVLKYQRIMDRHPPDHPEYKRADKFQKDTLNRMERAKNASEGNPSRYGID